VIFSKVLSKEGKGFRIGEKAYFDKNLSFSNLG